MQKYQIAPMPEPLSASLVEKLAKVETATVGHLWHFGFVDRAIRPLLDERRVVGCAVTLALPALDGTLLHHAVGLCRPGDMLVIDRLGDKRHACIGGGLANAAKAAGIVGAVVDGPCTDIEELRAFDFPVWCRGLSSITTGRYNIDGRLNLTISCGGVPVSAGDVVLADATGVVIMTREEADEIADQALQVQERGLRTQVRVRSGEKLGDISGASNIVRSAHGKSPTN
jgi:4-hydroxy-4-methyl-2-oxoglutarate aldolase